MRHCFRSLVFFAVLLLLPFHAPLLAQDVGADAGEDVGAEKPAVVVDSWLVLGPEAWPSPVTGGAPDGETDVGERTKEILEEPGIDLQGRWPVAGDAHALRPGAGAASWTEGAPWSTTGLRSDLPYRAWAATYLSVDFFTEATLEVDSAHPVRVLLDGAEVASRTESAEATGEDGASKPLEAELKLKPGKHLLLVTSLRDPKNDAAWTLSARLVGAEPWAAPAVSTSDRRHVGLTELLDQHVVRSLDLSPDGRHLLLTWSNVAVPADHRVTWHHVVDVETGEVTRELRSDVSGIEWSPDGASYAWTAPSWAAPSEAAEAKGHDLWISPAVGGPARRVLTNVENWTGHRWLPDGSGLVLLTTKSAEADERGLKRFRGLTDRWAGERDTSQLWWVSAEGGVLRRLTLDPLHDEVADVGAGRVLLRRQKYEVTERPFFTTSLLELDLETLELREIASEQQLRGWVGEVRYLDPDSSDDHRLLVLGSPQLFGGAGRDPDLPAGVVVNDYETEAFVFDPATGEATSFTRDWDPTVNGLRVAGGALYILGLDRSYQRIYRHELGTDGFTELPSGGDVVDHLDVSRDGTVLAYTGEGPSSPPAVFVRAAGRDAEPRRIVRAADDTWQKVELGRVETFSFVMDEGTDDATEILGRVNYPPDFDPSKKYPLIVSYYGGTVPSDRSFGGRYPRSYWAAHGFVVYTVQPSGATGFGQEFSARHVNAWGRRTADEILEGTKRFLDAHPFVDRERVGCIGASYGGFMTMYLVSHSDLFAAAVSHAGISNLASYWGQGWWGFLYSAAASADSYPWNARDLYVDQSPLYSADKIHTPLLLLHGDADTNVPPVESHQMYTALEVLGRDVELIEVGGENHQIFQYDKRKLWMETILSYFTKYLYDRPEWWSELWGTPEQPKG